MARVSLPSPPATELYLIQGELPETQDVDDASQWVTIYRELVTFADRTLRRLRREAGGNIGTNGSDAGDADERWMEGHLRRLQSRLEFWERRLWEVAGLDLDLRRRVLNYAGKRATLTRREAELLCFLARRPGQYFQRHNWSTSPGGRRSFPPSSFAPTSSACDDTWRPRLFRSGWSANRARGYGLVFTA